jgi:hypothetical protein
MSSQVLLQMFVIPRACRWILHNPRWPRSTGLALTACFLAAIALYTVYQEQLDRPVSYFPPPFVSFRFAVPSYMYLYLS